MANCKILSVMRTLATLYYQYTRKSDILQINHSSRISLCACMEDHFNSIGVTELTFNEGGYLPTIKQPHKVKYIGTNSNMNKSSNSNCHIKVKVTSNKVINPKSNNLETAQ